MIAAPADRDSQVLALGAAIEAALWQTSATLERRR
jgi:hypothetical protein